jgi:hypothetical protein
MKAHKASSSEITKTANGGGDSKRRHGPAAATNRKDDSQIVETAMSATQSAQDHSAKYREEILRRYEEPFQSSWFHDGLSE